MRASPPAPNQEELVDQPEVVRGVTRVSGPFTVEAVQPPEMSLGDLIEGRRIWRRAGENRRRFHDSPGGKRRRAIRRKTSWRIWTR